LRAARKKRGVGGRAIPVPGMDPKYSEERFFVKLLSEEIKIEEGIRDRPFLENSKIFVLSEQMKEKKKKRGRGMKG